MKTALCIIFLSVLLGCAAENKMVWRNPNKTEQEFYRDRAQCSSMAGFGGSSQVLPMGDSLSDYGYAMAASMQINENRQRIFNDCMMGQGWRLMNLSALSAIWNEKDQRAATECRQKRLNGELKNYAESAQCSNSRILEVHREAGDPNMDLMQLLCAYRFATAEREDNGEMTEPEANLATEGLLLRVGQEARWRSATGPQDDARRQAFEALLQGLGTTEKPIVCTPVRGTNTVIMSVTCQ